jgi:ketosteroid isomerase-like protein
MSQENIEVVHIEVVRQSFDAWNRGDLAAYLGCFDPEVEWTTTGRYVEAGTYRGHEGLLRYLGGLTAEFDDVEINPKELVGAGDRVVATVRITGRGRASGAPVELTLTGVCSFRDGRIVRIRNYADEAEALEAAGMRE